MADQEKMRVLVIDDEPEVIQAFRLAFMDKWEVHGINDPNELKRDKRKALFELTMFDLVVLDLLFDKSQVVTDENIARKIDSHELVGIEFLDWLTKAYPIPVMILSGQLVPEVVRKLRADYPHVLLKSKPLDLYSKELRGNIEWYTQHFFKFKAEDLLGQKS
jgi:CheY-like chemotaxis protein